VGFAGAEKSQHSKEIVYEEIAHSGAPRAILRRFSLVVPLALWPGMVRLDIDANVTPLLEAMDHGRDGYPRWIVVETTRRRQLTQTAESITTAAVDRGFVALPISAPNARRSSPLTRPSPSEPKPHSERLTVAVYHR
jgi:hypothetical protein